MIVTACCLDTAYLGSDSFSSWIWFLTLSTTNEINIVDPYIFQSIPKVLCCSKNNSATIHTSTSHLTLSHLIPRPLFTRATAVRYCTRSYKLLSLLLLLT
ncbi:hypothetical protein EYC84_004542 [Monilinia fructicola]|uniref:Uncharacterized protein n=1 Tax=Monilinia fructicola TaxID=38448 RepID=A0A5M9K1H0_MONFR|nr:hypothetical protein EYC84_004542 [Monilinia fructicola]